MNHKLAIIATKDVVKRRPKETVLIKPSVKELFKKIKMLINNKNYRKIRKKKKFLKKFTITKNAVNEFIKFIKNEK